MVWWGPGAPSVLAQLDTCLLLATQFLATYRPLAVLLLYRSYIIIVFIDMEISWKRIRSQCMIRLIRQS